MTEGAVGHLGPPSAAGRPRVGCLGAGWIGRARLAALAATGLVDIVGLADPDAAARDAASALAPRAARGETLEDLLGRELDGIVIATPSALHAEQAVRALRAGAAVFCQKPLARTAQETRGVLDVAQEEDLPVAVDLSYRHTRAARALRRAVRSGELGELHAIELVFHNAYGPDKAWFTQRALSGGGCLIDLGTHLLDLALWLTGSDAATVDVAHLSRHGRRVDPHSDEVEDFALAQLHLGPEVVARLACSWFLPAGRECVFEATLYGTAGAISMRNVDGSFYDFEAERHDGTRSETVAEPGDDWGAGAIADWGRRLHAGSEYDPGARELVALAEAIDAIYEAAA